MTDPKCCPFCGEPARVIAKLSWGRPGYKELGPPEMHYVECMGCLATGPQHPGRDEAVAMWNNWWDRQQVEIEDEIYHTFKGVCPKEGNYVPNVHIPDLDVLHDINCIHHLLDDIGYALFLVPDKTVKTEVGAVNVRKAVYECLDIIREHLSSMRRELG